MHVSRKKTAENTRAAIGLVAYGIRVLPDREFAVLSIWPECDPLHGCGPKSQARLLCCDQKQEPPGGEFYSNQGMPALA